MAKRIIHKMHRVAVCFAQHHLCEGEVVLSFALTYKQLHMQGVCWVRVGIYRRLKLQVVDVVLECRC